MADHPIFKQYDLEAERDEDGFNISIIGAKTPHEYEIPASPTMWSSGRSACKSDIPHLPPRNSEDYYEWIDLLEAIDAADGRFSMIEIGAGYGRWIVNGYLAAARHKSGKKLDVKIAAVEVDHRHIGWIADHCRVNGVPYDENLILQAAVSDKFGFDLFPISTIHHSFGLTIAGDVVNGVRDQLEALYNSGTRFCQVAGAQIPYQITPVFPVSHIVEKVVEDGFPVDFIDMDIQGVEFTAISASIESLNRHVKRMYVATHSAEIGTRLYDLLVANDWVVRRFYPGESNVHAEFGRFTTADGIISCINYRFVKDRI
jgi:hypothetical protein